MFHLKQYFQAEQKRHSTVTEALTVAEQMGAFCTVLTHFSQRYPRLPPCTDPGASFPPQVAVHKPFKG